jgi:hypothetical protein
VNDIDKFFEVHQHTIAALGAISTFAAVLVSLALALVAQRSSRTRIKARAAVSTIVHVTLQGKPKPRYVTVRITNVGLMPVTIPLGFFHWKVPFRREYWTVEPWDSSQHDRWVPKRDYPAEIKPRGSANFYLGEMARFRSTMSEMFNEVRHLRWRLRFIKAIVVTDDGKIFKVKLDRPVRRELAKCRHTGKSLDQL